MVTPVAASPGLGLSALDFSGISPALESDGPLRSVARRHTRPRDGLKRRGFYADLIRP